MNNNILVLGCGNFGTCLAHHLSDLYSSEHATNTHVSIYARDQSLIDAINIEHMNTKYMKGTVLPESLRGVGPKELQESIDRLVPSNDQEQVVEENSSADKTPFNVVIMCIPTQHLRSVLKQYLPLFTTPVKYGGANDNELQEKKLPLLIMANKGIEDSTLALPVHILAEVCGQQVADRAVFLSGPSFAVEVVNKQPTCVTVAGSNKETCLMAQQIFHSRTFRVYTSDDPIGVEVAGALKNVVAIASGMCAGLGYQMNARAALLTRGLSEIARVGHALGCKNSVSFLGLPGLGDLMLTCTSEKSRNFTVGYRMGKYGETLGEVVEHLGSVAEGVPTTKAAFELCRKLQLSSPIIDNVFSVLYQEKPLKEAVNDLLNLDATPEFDFRL